MGIFSELSREYLRHRLYGGHHRRRAVGWSDPRAWGPRTPQGYWMQRRHGHGPFGAYRPRSRVQVRGCGCCLPIPLALGTGAAVALRMARR